MTLYKDDEIEFICKINRNDIIPITSPFDEYAQFFSNNPNLSERTLNESPNIEIKKYELYGLFKKVYNSLKKENKEVRIIGRDMRFSYWSGDYDFDYYVILIKPIMNEMYIDKFLNLSLEKILW